MRQRLGKDSPQYASLLIRLFDDLLRARAYATAEVPLREFLAIRQHSHPDAWTTFQLQTVLGGALLGQKKYAAAEKCLLEGYRGMKQREQAMPAAARVRLAEALHHLAELYEEWGKPEQAAPWRKELQAAFPTWQLERDLLDEKTAARYRFAETRQNGKLTAQVKQQTHPLEFQAGKTYVLDLESTAFDPY